MGASPTGHGLFFTSGNMPDKGYKENIGECQGLQFRHKKACLQQPMILLHLYSQNNNCLTVWRGSGVPSHPRYDLLFMLCTVVTDFSCRHVAERRFFDIECVNGRRAGGWGNVGAVVSRQPGEVSGK